MTPQMGSYRQQFYMVIKYENECTNKVVELLSHPRMHVLYIFHIKVLAYNEWC
jgi:hypothetical protein